MKSANVEVLEKELIQQCHVFCILDYWVNKDEHHPDSFFIEQCKQFSDQSLERTCQSVLERENLSHKTIDQISAYVNEYTINLEEKSFTHRNYQECNDMLRSRGSSLRLLWSYQGRSLECLCGYVTEYDEDAFTVMLMERQLCSTVRLSVPMVGMINNNDIVVRNPCIDKMFFLKWDYEWGQQHESINEDFPLEVRIGKHLRQRVVKSYPDKDFFYTTFKRDCEKNVVIHEYGHAVIQYECLNMPFSALSECFQAISESNIVMTVLEVLADCAPKKGALQGVLTSLFDQDTEESQRCLKMYFSDIWFFDTGDISMYDYSELLTLILMDNIDGKSHRYDGIVSLLCKSVEDVVKEFVEMFMIKKDQKQCFSNALNYKEVVQNYQKKYEDIYQQNKDSIDTFLEEKRNNILKKCYDYLRKEDIYNECDNRRRKALFETLIGILMRDS
ncbi:hypothetical protein DID78_02425 [Candidatus Marinamargulisbacteria bacterium SCGC AG-343-D04]|nr:hypothetical protein DID78_02425 [Candidatus Marinamargulisbacteria bacterium SCGC AG-343-D04]